MQPASVVSAAAVSAAAVSDAVVSDTVVSDASTDVTWETYSPGDVLLLRLRQPEGGFLVVATLHTASMVAAEPLTVLHSELREVPAGTHVHQFTPLACADCSAPQSPRSVDHQWFTRECPLRFTEFPDWTVYRAIPRGSDALAKALWDVLCDEDAEVPWELFRESAVELATATDTQGPV